MTKKTTTRARHATKADGAPRKPVRAKKAAEATTTAEAKTGATTPRTRANTKQAKLIAMLQAKDGATVAEIADVFGWQAHTVRGALYGALKKKLGLAVTSDKVDGRGRVYRIGS